MKQDFVLIELKWNAGAYIFSNVAWKLKGC